MPRPSLSHVAFTAVALALPWLAAPDANAQAAPSTTRPAAQSPPATLSPAWARAWPMIMRYRAGEAPLPPIDNAAAWTAQQKREDKALAAMTAGAARGFGVGVEDAVASGVPIVRLTPKAWRDDGRILLYVHGGGFTSLSAHSTLMIAAPMAQRSGLRVVSVDYGLAPGQKWRATLDQAAAVYRDLLAQGYRPEGIGVFGDSAGGAILAGALLKLRDDGAPLPGAVILWSPWSDVTATGDTYQTLADWDPMLSFDRLAVSAAAYADPADQKNPYVSPVYGDYAKGFPPTLIQGGTREIFLSNMVRHYQALRAGGVDATLDLYEGMIHVFQPMAPGAPENQTALQRCVDFWTVHLKRR